MTKQTTRETRFTGLGYRNEPKVGWQFVDMATDAVIGPAYPTQIELLADAQAFYTARFI